jgi:hypothetical protein
MEENRTVADPFDPVPQPGDSDRDKAFVTQEWSPGLTSAVLYYLVCALLGGLFVVVGVWSLVSPTHDIKRGSAAVLVLFGAVFVAMSIVSWSLPARRVLANRDGSLSFISLRRKLDVGRGQLLSVETFPLDTGRVLPYRVRATNGRILLAAGFWATPGFESALTAHSPEARIVRLRRWRLTDGLPARSPKSSSSRLD